MRLSKSLSIRNWGVYEKSIAYIFDWFFDCKNRGLCYFLFFYLRGGEMKAIELTHFKSKEKFLLLVGGGTLIQREGIGGSNEVTLVSIVGAKKDLYVDETPKQIADLINGNQKESGWIKHTTDTIPFSDNELVVVEYVDGITYAGSSISFRWKKLNDAGDIAYYKIIERRK